MNLKERKRACLLFLNNNQGKQKKKKRNREKTRTYGLHNSEGNGCLTRRRRMDEGRRRISEEMEANPNNHPNNILSQIFFF